MEEDDKQVCSVGTVPCSSSSSLGRFGANMLVKLDEPRNNTLESHDEELSVMTRANDQRRIIELELELELLRAREEIARLRSTQTADVKPLECKSVEFEDAVAADGCKNSHPGHASGLAGQDGFNAAQGTSSMGFCQQGFAHELPRVELACFDGTPTD